jgi:cell division protein FtsW
MNKSLILLICPTFFILCLGVLMVFNTTSAEVLSRALDINRHFVLIKQLFLAFIGVLFGFFLWHVGYLNILKYSPYIFWITVFFLLLVIVPHVGQTINGAKRWIKIASFTFQPSEIAKFIVPIYFIFHICKNKKEMDFNRFLKVIMSLFISIFLILVEPDTGTCVIILTTLVVCFFLTKIKFAYWAYPLVAVIGLSSIAAYNMSHVKSRINIYLHPESDLKGKGHQPYQAKIAVGSGMLLGRGFGESLQKLDYLPEARNDYIAAIFAEESGFLGICLLVSLYMCIAISGFSIALQAKDIQGFYLGCILTFLISFQAFLNLGVVSGLLPSKGVTLPFFSQGGTSLIVNILAIFILISIAKPRQKKKWAKKRLR